MNKILLAALLFALPTASFAANLSAAEAQQLDTLVSELEALKATQAKQGKLTTDQLAQMAGFGAQLGKIIQKMQS